VKTADNGDSLINNAGICTEAEVPQPIATASEDAFDAHVRVNARGTFIASKYVIQQMKKQERHDSGVRGWVVNFGSMASLIGMVGLRK
jgi:NAD(P)-dependent dehydrogenase (short-subunit alcohol dehydrogenase family)